MFVIRSLCVAGGDGGVLGTREAVQSLLQDPRYETIEHRNRVEAVGVEMREWIMKIFERRNSWDVLGEGKEVWVFVNGE